jgi:hypothetical protein
LAAYPTAFGFYYQRLHYRLAFVCVRGHLALIYLQNITASGAESTTSAGASDSRRETKQSLHSLLSVSKLADTSSMPLSRFGAFFNEMHSSSPPRLGSSRTNNIHRPPYNRSVCHEPGGQRKTKGHGKDVLKRSNHQASLEI